MLFCYNIDRIGATKILLHNNVVQIDRLGADVCNKLRLITHAHSGCFGQKNLALHVGNFFLIVYRSENLIIFVCKVLFYLIKLRVKFVTTTVYYCYCN